MDAFSALHGLAGFAAGLTLLGFAVTVFAARVLWRLRRDRLALEAAERLESIRITSIVKRHVPSRLQSNKAWEEIPTAIEGIGRKFSQWMAVAILFCVVTASTGTVSWVLIDRNRQAIIAARNVPPPPPPVDTLKAIPGTWGWKYDSQLSCSENPHTISIVEGGKKLSIRFARPVWDGTKTIGGVEYTILGTEPNKLVLSRGSYSDSFGQPLRWYIRFTDTNTYDVRRSDRLQTTGDIIRCN